MPLKIPVGRIGQWKHPRYGTIKMSQQMFNDIIQNFKSKTIGRDPFIRIGHDKADDGMFGAARAEGWITDIVQEGDTLFALADPTNDDIANMVKSKQFRYASPEYTENYRDKETGSFKGAALEALALTNEPFLTRLPEARLLADPPDTFYLDYEEVHTMDKELLEQVKQTNTLLGSFTTKLAEWFGKKEDPNATPPTPGATTITATAILPNEETKKLADQLKVLEEENQRIKLAQRAADVNVKLQEYLMKGIPPVVIEQYRPILLADTGEKVIKLAEDKVISLSEQVYAALDAYPDNARVKLAQMGEHSTPPKAGSAEEVKKLADEDMKELGFTVDENGRYKL